MPVPVGHLCEHPQAAASVPPTTCVSKVVSASSTGLSNRLLLKLLKSTEPSVRLIVYPGNKVCRRAFFYAPGG